MSKAKANKLAYVGTLRPRDSDSWFTPPEFIAAASRTLDGIAFDPYSSPFANKTVGAKRFLTIDDDAFATPWAVPGPNRSLWVNPPYGRTMSTAIDTFLVHWHAELFDRAIVLTNNATETRWFQALAQESIAVCFPSFRIQFHNIDGKEVSGNTRGQCFFLFERDDRQRRLGRFQLNFGNYGRIAQWSI